MFKLAWAKNGTPETLSGTAVDLTISDLTAKKFNQFMYHALKNSSQFLDAIVFNGETGNLFASRKSNNGGAEDTNVSRDEIFVSTTADEIFGITYLCSISGEEKLTISFSVDRGTAGAANAPNRSESVGKYVPSPDADITQIDVEAQSGGALYATSSNISAIGTD